jgi:Cadmium resistance transporter
MDIYHKFIVVFVYTCISKGVETRNFASLYLCYFCCLQYIISYFGMYTTKKLLLVEKFRMPTQYVPLFASTDLVKLLIILGTFFLLVGVWCYASYKLMSQSAIADILTRYGSNLVPFVLVGLGVFIILQSNALNLLALGVCCLCLIGIVKKYKPSLEVEEN